MNKFVLLALIIFLIIAVVAYVFVNRDENLNVPSSENELIGQQILATPESLTSKNNTDFTGVWLFDGMTGVKDSENGYLYEWGSFSNSLGVEILARCSAPNNPTPTIGQEYVWEMHSNILVPVLDNEKGTLQRFWFPKLVSE